MPRPSAGESGCRRKRLTCPEIFLHLHLRQLKREAAAPQTSAQGKLVPESEWVSDGVCTSLNSSIHPSILLEKFLILQPGQAEIGQISDWIEGLQMTGPNVCRVKMIKGHSHAEENSRSGRVRMSEKKADKQGPRWMS